MQDQQTHSIIGAAMKIHRALGPGFLESVYCKALEIELSDLGFEYTRESPLNVYYREEVVGEFFADFLVEDRLIIEMKAVENIAKIHEVQTVNYLAATKIDHGLLLNFGSSSLQYRRKFRQYQPNASRSDNPVNRVNPVQN